MIPTYTDADYLRIIEWAEHLADPIRFADPSPAKAWPGDEAANMLRSLLTERQAGSSGGVLVLAHRWLTPNGKPWTDTWFDGDEPFPNEYAKSLMQSGWSIERSYAIQPPQPPTKESAVDEAARTPYECASISDAVSLAERARFPDDMGEWWIPECCYLSAITEIQRLEAMLYPEFSKRPVRGVSEIECWRCGGNGSVERKNISDAAIFSFVEKEHADAIIELIEAGNAWCGLMPGLAGGPEFDRLQTALQQFANRGDGDE